MKRKKSNLFFILLAVALFSYVVFAQEAEEQEKKPKLTGAVDHETQVQINEAIIFTATCSGENTNLIVCKSEASCNSFTQPQDIICMSEASNEETKSCSFLPAEADLGEHEETVATCCNKDNECDNNLAKIKSWVVVSVTDETFTALDENNHKVPLTVEKNGVVAKIIFTNYGITNLEFVDLEGTTVHVSSIVRGLIEPENTKFNRVYALDTEQLSFTQGILATTAKDELLYICKFWDMELSVCLGSWDLVRRLEKEQEYSINIEKGSFAFAEGYSSAPVNITEPLPAKQQFTIIHDSPVESGASITFSASCSDKNTQIIVCRSEDSCNSFTQPQYILCLSPVSDQSEKSCQYTADDNDIGEHKDALGSCCTEKGDCPLQTKKIESWIVEEKINRTIAVPEEKEKPFIFKWSYLDEPSGKLRDGGKYFAYEEPYSIIPDSDKFHFDNNSVEIEVVAKINNDSTGVLLSKHDYLEGKIFELKVNAEGTLGFEVGDKDISTTVETKTPINNDQFHSIKIILQQQLMQIAVDNITQAEGNISKIIDINSNAPIAIGVDIGYLPWTGVVNNPFKGVISDVRLVYK